MSFRKRNVVLSGPPSGDAQPPRQGLLPVRGPRRAPIPTRTPTASTTSRASTAPIRPAQSAAPKTKLPDVSAWPLASRPELLPETRAQLEPGKQRLRLLSDQEKQKRQRSDPVQPLGPGARPSPFDGRPITSTGTDSLDPLLAGYGGLVLGHSLLVEEQGTTDFAIALLRAYAAEGLVQGHHVHVLGFGPAWKNDLPGLASSAKPPSAGTSSSPDHPGDKMKIAWRYEALAARPSPDRSRGPQPSPSSGTAAAAVFCHTFDMSKRLAASDIKGTLHPFPLPNPLRPSPAPEHVHSPLKKFLAAVQASLDATPPSSIHRVVIPSFLAPTLYAMDGWSFPYVVALVAGLRGMLRRYGRRLTVVLSLSTSLYGRSEFHVRQLEKLCDNVVELIPLPPGPPSIASQSTSSRDKTPADKMQGWFKFHKLQIYSEMGGAGASPQGTSLRENFCFSLSGSKGMLISPYSLPPVDDDSHSEKLPASTSNDGLEF